MKKALCRIFGHDWLYGNPQGIQRQPTLRACQRCGKVQDFYGEMTRMEGTFGQLWYSKKDWRSKDEQIKHLEKVSNFDRKFNELTSK